MIHVAVWPLWLTENIPLLKYTQFKCSPDDKHLASEDLRGVATALDPLEHAAICVSAHLCGFVGIYCAYLFKG